MNIKIVKKYEIRVEENKINDDETPVIMYSIYAEDGGYVGSVENAVKYFKKGILPEKSLPTHDVCSIGKSLIDGKWYGWSHRAMYGFKIGDKVKEGSCCAESGFIPEYIAEHPEEDRSLPIGFEAKTEEDTKKMAIAFADSVS